MPLPAWERAGVRAARRIAPYFRKRLYLQADFAAAGVSVSAVASVVALVSVVALLSALLLVFVRGLAVGRARRPKSASCRPGAPSSSAARAARFNAASSVFQRRPIVSRPRRASRRAERRNLVLRGRNGVRHATTCVYAGAAACGTRKSRIAAAHRHVAHGNFAVLQCIPKLHTETSHFSDALAGCIRKSRIAATYSQVACGNLTFQRRIARLNAETAQCCGRSGVRNIQRWCVHLKAGDGTAQRLNGQWPRRKNAGRRPRHPSRDVAE